MMRCVSSLGVFCYIMVCCYCVAVAPGDVLCVISWCVLLQCGVLFCVAVAPSDMLCVISWCVLLHYGVFCVAVVPSDAPDVPCAISCCLLLHYGVLFCVSVAPGTAPVNVSVNLAEDDPTVARITWSPPLMPNGVITGEGCCPFVLHVVPFFNCPTVYQLTYLVPEVESLAACLWNSIPTQIKSCNSLVSFKTQLHKWFKSSLL